MRIQMLDGLLLSMMALLTPPLQILSGVKPTPKNEFLGVPVVSHDISLKLRNEFDARTAWSLCSSIGRILGSLWFLLGIWGQ
ncbi:hypothetical protein YC2023_097684 [Brassica napus]